jgi:GMP synthase-like glutamine amidotransferase
METRIAIVDCQPLPVFVEERTGYKGFFEAFQKLFELAGAKNASFYRYNARLGEFPSLEDAAPNVVVISGSFSSAYNDEDWIFTLKKNLQNARGRVPIIGVCFGHQVLAEALGGKCGPMSEGPEVGCVTTQLTDAGRKVFESLSLDGLEKQSVRLVYFHFDEVKRLPPGAVLLAHSVSCPIEAFCMPGEQIICLQGHPEFGLDAELIHALLDSSRMSGKLQLADYENAKTSLKLPSDSLAIGACLLHFALSAQRFSEPLKPQESD